MEKMKAILLLAAAMAFVAAPLFTPGFGGFDTSAFPVQGVDPSIQPAGYAFAIWGLIYLWLLAHAGFGLFLRAENAAWDAPRWGLFASLALGASWLAVAMAEPVLAVVQIWAMLGAALWALAQAPVAGPDRWLRVTPLALYAGWLTAASCVGLGVVLVGYGVLGDAAATLLMLGLATGIGLGMQLRLAPAPEYAGAIIWALVGVIVANVGAGLIVPLICVLAIAALAAAAWRTEKARSA